MTKPNLIILKEIFPLQHEKILTLLESNSDLRSIVDDLLECHEFLTKESAAQSDAQVPRAIWEELYEDLRKEAIELVTREMS